MKKLANLFKFHILVVSLVLLSACGGSDSSTSTDGTGTGTGTFSTSGFGFGFGETADPNVELWRFEADDDLTATAIATDGTIYVGSDDAFLYAINSDGSQKWKFRSETGDSVTVAPAISSDGTVYFADWGGTLYALNTDGSKKWSFATGSLTGVSGIAIADDGTVLVVTDSHGLVAFNPDGTTKWNIGATVSSSAVNSPVIDPHGSGIVYHPSDNLIAYDLSNGVEKWQFIPDDSISRGLAIGSDKTLYFGDLSGVFYAVDQAGVEKWRYDIGSSSSVVTSPVIGPDGTIYVIFYNSGDQKLYAFTPAGALKWSFNDIPFGAEEPVIGQDGAIYITTNTMTALNPDGTIKWDAVTLRNGTGAPSIGIDGTLFAPLRSTLFALNVDAGGLATSAWPMGRQNVRRTAVASN